jgi:hypothetical protein
MGCGNAQLCYLLKMIWFSGCICLGTQHEATFLRSVRALAWVHLLLSFLGIEHELVEIDLSSVSKSRLTFFA